MTARPQLRLLNKRTGELVEQDDRDILIAELEGKLRGSYLREGLLKKELRDLQAVEPDHEVIREVLDYWRERCKPRATFAPGSERWKKVRARLREKLEHREPLTPAELKLAVDGALTDRWHTQTGMPHRLDAKWLFRSCESVEELRDLALGFEAQAGIGLADLVPLAAELRVVSWKHLLATCLCGHKRLEHAHADPTLEGRELCFLCGCGDFEIDPFDKFNVKADPHLARWAS